MNVHKMFANFLLKSCTCHTRTILALVPFSVSCLLVSTVPIASAQPEPANVPIFSLASAAVNQQQDALVFERGELEAVSNIEIRAPFEATILKLTPEGEAIKKGDLLLTLDTSGLEDQRGERQVSIARLNAQMVRLEKKAKQVERRLAIQDRYKLALRKVFTQEKQSLNAKDGEFATQLKLLEAKKQQAINNLEFAKTRHERLVEAHKKGAIGPDEVAQSAAEMSNAESDLLVIGLESDLLTKGKPLKLAELELRAAEQELNIISEIDELQEKAAALAAEQEANQIGLQVETTKLKKIEEQLKSAEIVAPADGIVSYHSARSSRGEIGPIQEGAAVREGQAIMRIADVSHLQVRVVVGEAEIGKIKKDQKVSIRFDAERDTTYAGTVKEVASVPLPGRIGGKDYLVLVSLLEPGKELKIGMTAVVQFNFD